MKGKHILVTGATGGIGEVTATTMAHMGAVTVVVGRNEAKCQALIGQIKAETGNENVSYLVADLSSIAETRAVAEAYKAKFDRLDVLINNAGGMFDERQESVDGYEMNVALNYIGPFVLMHELLGLLQETAVNNPDFGARIVNVSSMMHSSGVDWDNLMSEKKYSMFNTYGQSKAMLNMTTFELASRLAGSGVTVNSLHPGAVKTGIVGKAGNSLFARFMNVLVRLFFVTPEKGAETSIYLATSPEVAGVSGKYFESKKEKAAHQNNLDPADWQKLWQMSEVWVGNTAVS